MAQLLVFQRDNGNAAGSYKIGDVVTIAEDSHVFSAAEKQHPFAVVKVAGAKADYAYLLESEPATLRDQYPRSLLAIKRLMIPLLKADKLATRARRKHSVDLTGAATRKQFGGV